VTTHPALGVVTTQTTYATDVLYKINVERVDGSISRRDDDREKSNHGDKAALQTFVVKFGPVGRDGSQSYKVSRVVGRHTEQLGRGRTGRVSEIDDGWAFAGPRSDPFFFDLDAFNNTAQATGGRGFCANGQGVDFFKSLNTNAIVLKLDNEMIGSKVNIWAATSSLDGMTQYDRMGRPAINTVFNGFKKVFNNGVDADKNEFNAIKSPKDDPTIDGGKFRKNVIDVLQEFSSLGTKYTDAQAAGLADVLLPDVLPYDTSNPNTDGVFNGRAPANDVIDTELNVVTNGAVKGDCVGPHDDYLSNFPYLGTPH
jgi:Domain of unknown function (DUF4331)